MIKRIVSFALHQPLVILFATLLFVGGGLIAFKNLPVEAFPDVTDTQVTVITLYPGRRGRKAGHDSARSCAVGPAQCGAHVLAHTVRAFVPDFDFRR